MFMLMLSMNAAATTFYVNPAFSAANDQNAGTDPAAPWMSLNPTKWVDGCVVMLSPGTDIVLETATVNANVTLQGTSKEDVIIEGLTEDDIARGSESPRFFLVTESGKLTLKNITLKNFNTKQSMWGGMFMVGMDATLTLENVDITNAILPGCGGAAVYSEGTLNCKNVKFENCISAMGAAVAIQGLGVATFDNVTFKNNSTDDGIDAYKLAGAVYINAQDPIININNSYFDSNSCQNASPNTENQYYPRGGAMFVYAHPGHTLKLHITNSTFNNNFAGYQSGAIQITKSEDPFLTPGNVDLLFTNNTFVRNHSDGIHGQLLDISGPNDENMKGSVSFVNNTFMQNGPTKPTNDFSNIFLNSLGVTLSFVNNLVQEKIWNPDLQKYFGYGFCINTGTYVSPTFKGNIFDNVGGDLSQVVAQIQSADNTFGSNAADSILTFPASGVPYAKINDATSIAIDRGIDEFILGSNLVPLLDVRGSAKYGLSKDAGAFEYNPDFSSITKSVGNPAILAYPNPFNDIIYLSKEAASISVFDLTGVRQINAKNVSEIDASNLHSGLYILRVVNTDGTVLTQKMQK